MLSIALILGYMHCVDNCAPPPAAWKFNPLYSNKSREYHFLTSPQICSFSALSLTAPTRLRAFHLLGTTTTTSLLPFSVCTCPLLGLFLNSKEARVDLVVLLSLYEQAVKSSPPDLVGLARTMPFW